MRYKAHIVGGLVSSYLTAVPIISKFNFTPDIVSIGAFAVGNFIGSVLPDIDEKNTYITNRLHSKLHWFLKHRGLMHYPLVMLGIYLLVLKTVPLSTYPTIFITGLIVGMMSHYILDTPEGIAWLFPIIRRNIFKLTPSQYPKPVLTSMKNIVFDLSFVLMLFIIVNKYLIN